MLLLLCRICLGSFQKSNPVLWYKTHKPVVSGTNRVLVNIKYQSPCNIFLEEPFKALQGQEQYEFCNVHFQENFIDPLLLFCRRPEDQTPKDVLLKNKNILKREKRLAFITLGIIALISVAISTTIGVSASSIVTSNRLNSKLEFIENKERELLERMEAMHQDQLKIKEIVTELQKEIKEIGGALKAVTEAVNVLNSNMPRSIYYISNIISRFIMVKDRLQDVARDWNSGKVSNKLLDIYNFTLSCYPNCDLSSAQPISCDLDLLRKTITLIFDIQTIKPKVHVMRSDAFTMYKRPGNKTSLCPRVYVGPIILEKYFYM